MASKCLYYHLEPQPQPHGIWAHGNTGSLTHWERPGIEPLFSWILVGFVNYRAMKETSSIITSVFHFVQLKIITIIYRP